MNHDQADVLRQLVLDHSLGGAPSGACVPLVVVGGGKGGVGTTTVAVNLAIALARQGRRAVFVDADLNHGGSALGGLNSPRGSLVDVLTGRRTVHEVLERGPSGIHVLSGAWASVESTECPAGAVDRFVADLKNLTAHADVIVIDAGSSRGALVRRWWHAAIAVLVVTKTDPSSIMECYAAIKVLRSPDGAAPIHTLVNEAREPAEVDDVHARIAEACRRFLGLRTSSAGHVPSCAASGGEEVLLFPAESASARLIDRAADALWAQVQLASARPLRRTMAECA